MMIGKRKNILIKTVAVFLMVAVLFSSMVICVSAEEDPLLPEEALQETETDNAEETEVFDMAAADDLLWVSEQVNGGANDFFGKTVRLTGNIELNDSWVAIGSAEGTEFCGCFDANGYQVRNLPSGQLSSLIETFGEGASVLNLPKEGLSAEGIGVEVTYWDCSENGHREEIAEKEKSATYFEEGHTEKVVCSACGEIVKESEPKERKHPSLSVKLSSSKAKLSWQKISGVKGYEVYRRDGERYVLLKSISGEKNISYTTSTLASGSETFFTIRAFRGEGDEIEFSEYSNEVSAAIRPKKPSISVSRTGENVKIKWKKIKEAKAYEIFRSTKKNGEYALIGQTEELQFLDDPGFGETYYYKARTVSADGIESLDSSIKYVKLSLKAPSISLKKETKEDGTVCAVLTWKKITGAASYEVLRSESKKTGYVSVGETDRLSFEDRPVFGKTYYYKVCSVSKTGEKKSSYSSVKSTNLTLGTPSISLSKTTDKETGRSKVKLTWKTVSGAKGYEIYRGTEKKGNYALLASTETTSFTDVPAGGKTYYYKVRAYYKEKEVFSEYSSYKSASIKLSAPKLSLRASKNSETGEWEMTLSWGESTGATSYELFRKEGDGEYELYKTFDSGTLKYSEILPEDKLYSFKVRAVSEDTISRTETAYSKEEQIAVSLAAGFRLISSVDENKVTTATLRWYKVPNAKRYVIYNKTTANGKFAVFKEVDEHTTSLSFKQKAGYINYYKLAALDANGKKIDESPVKLMAAKFKEPVFDVKKMNDAQRLELFNGFLESQLGMPYVNGGQGTYLEIDKYEKYIDSREPDETYRASAKGLCKSVFDKGAASIQVFDCSGLGMYFLQNLTGICSSDMTANGMRGKCTLIERKDLKKGCWVFKTNETGRAVHVGFVVDDKLNVIEARSNAYGVVKRHVDEGGWTVFGIPSYFSDAIK